MIRTLATGTLYGSPQTRTSAAGKAYTTAKLKADGKDGAITWCSLIAFGEQAERLATLKEGAAMSVSGRLSLVVDELATLKGRPRPPRPRQPEAAAAGFDDAGGWRP